MLTGRKTCRGDLSSYYVDNHVGDVATVESLLLCQWCLDFNDYDASSCSHVPCGILSFLRYDSDGYIYTYILLFSILYECLLSAAAFHFNYILCRYVDGPHHAYMLVRSCLSLCRQCFCGCGIMSMLSLAGDKHRCF